MIAAGMLLSFSLQAADWTKELVAQNPDIITSVVPIPRSVYSPAGLHSYWINYRQPLQHDEPELGDLPLRALFTVRTDRDFQNQMVQMYVGGYNLSDQLGTYPDYYADYFFGRSTGEVAGRYGGSLLMPEHRYFGESVPEAPWATLGYCEAKEAAADFHNLLEAMKKVFHGKWAISGVSKGGTTTAIQHAFYPEDADCFLPYSGPFLNHERDTRMQEYWMTQAWNPDLREALLHIQTEMLHRPRVYELYKEYNGWATGYESWDRLMRSYLLASVGMLDCDLHAYSSRSEVYNLLYDNVRLLARHKLEDYSDEMLLYMIVYATPKIDPEQYEAWYNLVFGVDEDGFEVEKHVRRGAANKRSPLDYKLKLIAPVYGITASEWDSATSGYWYQAARELGYFDLKWDFFYDTQAEIDSVNEMWQEWAINVQEFANDTYVDVEFNPGLMQMVRQNTGSTDRNLLFIYGSDDMWTGACMDDDKVNGENVRQYILNAQNHGVSINAETDAEVRDEIWSYLDRIFLPQEESIRTIVADKPARQRHYDLWGRPLDGRTRRTFIIK